MSEADAFFHPDCLRHDTGHGLFDVPGPGWLEVPEIHPESAPRVRNMRGALHGVLGARLRWRDGRHATPDELATLHDPAYVEEIRAAAEAGTRLTATTLLAPGSFEAATAAAGTALAAADAILGDETDVAYALVRPPGHHASQRRADGYCFFNSTALAAERARRAGLARVAILDWDVHHGTGTQTIFYERADVLCVSFHMRHGSWGPSHPETGAPEERGAGEGEGYNVNVELGLGAGDGAYLAAFDELVEPVVDAFAPELVVVACGQDAGQFDPNGRQAVTCAGFHALGRRARALAARHAGGRLLLVQEGGYAPTHAAACLAATICGALGDPEPPFRDPTSFLPDEPARCDDDLARVRAALAPYWPALG